MTKKILTSLQIDGDVLVSDLVQTAYVEATTAITVYSGGDVIIQGSSSPYDLSMAEQEILGWMGI
jgi:hypothetical protein